MLKTSLVALSLTLLSNLASAQAMVNYKVTITNITPAQAFTPQLVITHPYPNHLFVLGEAASAGLEALAEGGAQDGLMAELANTAYDMNSSEGLLMPGASSTVMIRGRSIHGRISLAAMLLPTNDTFVAMDGVRLPKAGQLTYLLGAYDAGTEYNDQWCKHIPGPTCMGSPFSDVSDTDEGFVHIGNGFQEMGGGNIDGFEVLGPHPYDWGSYVAKVVITRVK